MLIFSACQWPIHWIPYSLFLYSQHKTTLSIVSSTQLPQTFRTICPCMVHTMKKKRMSKYGSQSLLQQPQKILNGMPLHPDNSKDGNLLRMLGKKHTEYTLWLHVSLWGHLDDATYILPGSTNLGKFLSVALHSYFSCKNEMIKMSCKTGYLWLYNSAHPYTRDIKSALYAVPPQP